MNYLRRLTEVKDVTAFTKQLKWNFAGHIQRLEDNRWTKKIELWVPNKRRKKRTS